MQWPLLQAYDVEDSLRSMFLKREGAACSHNVHNALYSRCMLWGIAFSLCSQRGGRCTQPQCTQWPLLQVYAVGDSLRSMFLKERALLWQRTSSSLAWLMPPRYYCIHYCSTIASLARCWLGYPERLERGGHCWLLKLRWMGTQRGQMKGVLYWLVCWGCQAGTSDFCSALAALVGPEQNFFFLTLNYFNTFIPIPQQAGQAAVLCCLSLSLWVSGGTLFFLLKLWAAFRHGFYCNNLVYWKLCYSFFCCIFLCSAFVLFYFLFKFLGASGLMTRF
jgi:hypothetical protein